MPMLGRSLLYVRSHCVAKSWAGIAKLFAAERKALAVVGSRGHFGCIIGPETERIGAGVAV